LEKLSPLVGVVRPNPGQTVRLQLEADGGCIADRLAGAGRSLAQLVGDTEQVLDVVAHLVRDDVGLREIARGSEAPIQLVVEGEVDVNLAIGRAVERPDGRGGEAAGRPHTKSAV